MVVGLGGVGASSVPEFAKAGVGEVRLVDSDYVDPGNSVRWPLGLSVAGEGKPEALGTFIRENWPSTAVRIFNMHIGGTRQEGHSAQHKEIETVVNDVSLIFDATTEYGVQHYLSQVAREIGVPYVCLWTVPGAWSGIVVRVKPDPSEPCWICFMRMLEPGGGIPELPSDPNGNVQPAGCADPTFTGSGFDVASISLHAVRLSVSTLCENMDNAYPPSEADVIVETHRRDRAVLAPDVSTYQLRRHPECQAHGS